MYGIHLCRAGIESVGGESGVAVDTIAHCRCCVRHRQQACPESAWERKARYVL